MAKPTANLSKSSSVDTSLDTVIIMKMLEDIPGGETLDTTGFAADVILAGHVIIEETSTGNLKPMPVSGDAYDTLPASHTYKGILVSSIETAKPFASVMVRGTVNEAASMYVVPAGAKTALPLIRFTKD